MGRSVRLPRPWNRPQPLARKQHSARLAQLSRFRAWLRPAHQRVMSTRRTSQQLSRRQSTRLPRPVNRAAGWRWVRRPTPRVRRPPPDRGGSGCCSPPLGTTQLTALLRVSYPRDRRARRGLLQLRAPDADVLLQPRLVPAGVRFGRRDAPDATNRWMGTARLSLVAVLDRLAATYGEPAPPVVTDPFEQVLWENVAYLADDGRRAAAFAALHERVGTAPARILAAPDRVLAAVASAGILPATQAAKLRRCAEIALAEFGGDLNALRRLPLAPAKRALQRFPGIGEPGAEKIVLFARIHPVPALDSNGVRAVLRLGFGRAAPSYATTYRAVEAAVRDQVPADA